MLFFYFCDDVVGFYVAVGQGFRVELRKTHSGRRSVPDLRRPGYFGRQFLLLRLLNDVF